MANEFYFILTKVGLAKLVNATLTQSKVEYSYIAFGDGNGGYYEPTDTATALLREVYRAAISIVSINEQASNQVIVETVIPANVGNFTIREIGLIDSDGDLVGIGKYPATYKPSTEQGAAKDLIVRIIVETSNANSITLKVDPSIAIASRKYVDDKVATITVDLTEIERNIIAFQNNLTNLQQIVTENQQQVTKHLEETNPHGTKKADIGLGNVENYEIATQAEAENALSTTKYMTPLRTGQAIKWQLDKFNSLDGLVVATDANTAGVAGKFVTNRVNETTLNLPISQGGILKTYIFNQNSATQKYEPALSITNRAYEYIRKRTGGTWGEWELFATNKDIARKTEQIDNLYTSTTLFSGDVTLTNDATITLSQSIYGFKEVTIYTGQDDSWFATTFRSIANIGFVATSSIPFVGIVNGELTRAELRIASGSTLSVLSGNNIRLRAITVRDKDMGALT